MAILSELQEDEAEIMYDIFLSFRGKDTRLGFTDYLYEALPTHVRKQESTFGEALLEHKRRMENEKDQQKKVEGARKLEMWRKGLTEVADLKGKDATGRREMVVIQEVVKEINTRLELHLQRKIPHLIGMDDSIFIIKVALLKALEEDVHNRHVRNKIFMNNF
ncbi:hypothetical protein L2E82_11289 [Cichorium intybus]|uniref:Uncharacterized protein n=1 Tax=Cichorium intybus TaxID=13427 RepID=A0ACB9GE03_CICIN|nr:hypothetical protein L2E82_11289 [Cichorium intybus]